MTEQRLFSCMRNSEINATNVSFMLKGKSGSIQSLQVFQVKWGLMQALGQEKLEDLRKWEVGKVGLGAGKMAKAPTAWLEAVSPHFSYCSWKYYWIKIKMWITIWYWKRLKEAWGSLLGGGSEHGLEGLGSHGCHCWPKQRSAIFPAKKKKKGIKWQLTPVVLPGKSHGHRSLSGYSPWSPRVGHDWAHTGISRKHTLGSATLGGKCKSLHSKGRTLSEWRKEDQRAKQRARGFPLAQLYSEKNLLSCRAASSHSIRAPPSGHLALYNWGFCSSSVAQWGLTVGDRHGLQYTRLPCPSTTPGAYSNLSPSSRWCHPTISSSVVPFSSCLQSFPASGSFPKNQFFESGGQNIGVSASASVLPMNIQGSFPLGLTGLISFQSKGLSRVFSNTTVQKQFFAAQLSLWSNSHIHTWLLEKP